MAHEMLDGEYALGVFRKVSDLAISADAAIGRGHVAQAALRIGEIRDLIGKEIREAQNAMRIGGNPGPEIQALSRKMDMVLHKVGGGR